MGNLAHKSQYDRLYVIGTGLLSVKNLIKLSIVFICLPIKEGMKSNALAMPCLGCSFPPYSVLPPFFT